MTPKDVAWARGDYTILDVRTPEELAVAHVSGTVDIPLDQLPERWKEIPTDKPVVAMCHHGVRSQKAALFLLANGIDATSMVGGIDAWSLSVDHSVPRY